MALHFKRGFVALSLAAAPWLAQPAHAQPTAAQVMTDAGLSADAQQRVMNGEFYTGNMPTVSDEDLSVAIAFLVKTAPDDLAKQVMAGDLISADPQVRAHGKFSGSGSLADIAALQISDGAAQAYMNARPGSALNLSTGEIAAFAALKGGNRQAVTQRLQQMLLARFQAYRSSGLAGIAPYDRGGGSASAPAEDLRKASRAAKGLRKYLPTLEAVLRGSQAAPPGVQQDFYWMSYQIDGKPTYALTHVLSASDGAARAVVQRQYYVSTGYDCEQAIAGFLPVQEGTVVAYTNHTFTGQVAGFGGSMKRSIGRRVMESKLKQIFETERGMVTH
jgi:hypothetical protein